MGLFSDKVIDAVEIAFARDLDIKKIPRDELNSFLKPFLAGFESGRVKSRDNGSVPYQNDYIQIMIDGLQSVENHNSLDYYSLEEKIKNLGFVFGFLVNYIKIHPEQATISLTFIQVLKNFPNLQKFLVGLEEVAKMIERLKKKQEEKSRRGNIRE